MKTNRLLNLLCLISLAGCHPDAIAPAEDVAALYQRFHGKYKPIQAIASEAVDVNL